MWGFSDSQISLFICTYVNEKLKRFFVRKRHWFSYASLLSVRSSISTANSPRGWLQVRCLKCLNLVITEMNPFLFVVLCIQFYVPFLESCWFIIICRRVFHLANGKSDSLINLRAVTLSTQRKWTQCLLCVFVWTTYSFPIKLRIKEHVKQKFCYLLYMMKRYSFISHPLEFLSS